MEFHLLNGILPEAFDYSFLFVGLIVLCLILLILVIVEMLQIKKLKKQYKKFMTGKDAADLESQIIKLFEDNKYLLNLTEANKKDIRSIKHEIEYSFNKMGIIRYDAFQHMGGMMSFSIAMLNKRNDGYILNSVHNMDGCYTYIKEIKKGYCEIELSNEEKEALAKAMKEG